MAVWVQGVRRQDDPSITAADAWMELLYRRLMGHLELIVTGVKTEESETFLGLRPSAYYYLDAVVPGFGHLTVGHRGHAKEALPVTATSPFDTGGLARRKIPLHTNLSRDERKLLVRRWTYVGETYLKPFRNWRATAFASRMAYVVGRKPTSMLVSEVDLKRARERAWLWEGRVVKARFARPPVTPVRVYFRDGDKNLYVNWLRSARILRGNELSRHLRLLNRLSSETASPSRAMRDFVVRGRRRWVF